MPRQKEADPNQIPFLVPEGVHEVIATEQALEAMKPVEIPRDPMVDTNPGFSVPVNEGILIMSGVLHDIARSRSNNGFMKLEATSRPVKQFAEQIDQDPEDAMNAVRGATQGHPSRVPRLHFTHKERAQSRLNYFNEKQIKRGIEHVGKHPEHGFAEDEVRAILPPSVGELEYKYFDSGDPALRRAKTKIHKRAKDL